MVRCVGGRSGVLFGWWRRIRSDPGCCATHMSPLDLPTPFPHLTLFGVAPVPFSKENPPPLAKLMPVMAEYDMGEVPVLEGPAGTASELDEDAGAGVGTADEAVDGVVVDVDRVCGLLEPGTALGGGIMVVERVSLCKKGKSLDTFGEGRSRWWLEK